MCLYHVWPVPLPLQCNPNQRLSLIHFPWQATALSWPATPIKDWCCCLKPSHPLSAEPDDTTVAFVTGALCVKGMVEWKIKFAPFSTNVVDQTCLKYNFRTEVAQMPFVNTSQKHLSSAIKLNSVFQYCRCGLGLSSLNSSFWTTIINSSVFIIAASSTKDFRDSSSGGLWK